jgi:transketolase
MAEELKQTRDAYGEALVELGKDNPNIVVLDADLSSSTQTKKFAVVYPNRFFNMGIAEEGMMDTAAGLASCGKIAFASTFAMFATGKAWEMVRNTVAYDKLNVKIVATHAGVTVGEDGSSHQALEDIAIMRAIPNMVVISPADFYETKAAIKAVAEYKGPVYVRLSRSKSPVIFDANCKFKIGKATILKEGKDVAIVACGILVPEALKAAEKLASEGVSATVINMSTIKPLDKTALVDAAKKTGLVVTVEEHNIIGGLGGAVAETLGEQYPVQLVRIGVPDVFGQSGDGNVLLQKFGLTADEIAKKVKEAVAKKVRR